MTSRVLAEGNGAAGAVGYVMHDAPIDGRPQKTSKRVIGVAVRGVPLGCSPELLARIMQRTITDAPWLKRRAGVPPGGRKLKYGIVHMGLSWPLHQHPTWDEMEAAGDSWLAANGLQDHYCVMAAHRESGKPDHLHLVICRIDPETGRAHRGNLATGGSRWAEEYERLHGGIQIPTRVERNRIRDQRRQLKKEAQEAQKAGPTLLDRARKIVGAPDTVERIGRRINKLKGKMPPIEPTRSAGRHRQRADAKSRPWWNELLNAQRKEREALREAPEREVAQLLLEQRLGRQELHRRLKQGEEIVDPPRTRVPAPPGRSKVRPPRYAVVVADPGEDSPTTEWFRANRPEPTCGRQLAAAGYTPRRLEEALGPERGPPWATTMRQHIARRKRPKDLSTLFDAGADPVQQELKREWCQLHDPSEADAEALLAAAPSVGRLEEALGRETARRYIVAAPPPKDLSTLFETGADPERRELQREWFRVHEPTEAIARALVRAAQSVGRLEEALGRETAKPYIEAVLDAVARSREEAEAARKEEEQQRRQRLRERIAALSNEEGTVFLRKLDALEPSWGKTGRPQPENAEKALDDTLKELADGDQVIERRRSDLLGTRDGRKRLLQVDFESESREGKVRALTTIETDLKEAFDRQEEKIRAHAGGEECLRRARVEVLGADAQPQTLTGRDTVIVAAAAHLRREARRQLVIDIPGGGERLRAAGWKEARTDVEQDKALTIVEQGFAAEFDRRERELRTDDEGESFLRRGRVEVLGEDREPETLAERGKVIDRAVALRDAEVAERERQALDRRVTRLDGVFATRGGDAVVIASLDAHKATWRESGGPADIDLALDTTEQRVDRPKSATGEHELVLDAEKTFPKTPSAAWQLAGKQFPEGSTHAQVSQRLSDRALLRALATEREEPPPPTTLVQRLVTWLRAQVEKLAQRLGLVKPETADIEPSRRWQGLTRSAADGARKQLPYTYEPYLPGTATTAWRTSVLSMSDTSFQECRRRLNADTEQDRLGRSVVDYLMNAERDNADLRAAAEQQNRIILDEIDGAARREKWEIARKKLTGWWKAPSEDSIRIEANRTELKPERDHELRSTAIENHIAHAVKIIREMCARTLQRGGGGGGDDGGVPDTPPAGRASERTGHERLEPDQGEDRGGTRR